MTADTRKTLAVAVAAAALALLAWATMPRLATPASLEDRGQPFFPAFTDPNAATSLEVVEFDEQTSVARPFKVENRTGRWIIPSQQNYPADGGDRLASIAAAIIALRKDDIAGENVADQERCGVLDPLDETLPTPKGRGTRITVRGKNDALLADVIAGKPVEGRPNFRYVRLPDQRRIYVARLDELEISTRFEDWIERNLLLVDRSEIDEIVVRNYSTNPKTGDVEERETLRVRRKAPAGPGDDDWTLDGIAPGEKINAFNMNLLVTKLVDLEIVDVRPKPPGVTATLTRAGDARISQADVADLGGKGFYFTQTGQMLSNQGEVLIHTTRGIFYALRFGEVAHGVASGAAVNRYLFISVGFDSSATGGKLPEQTRTRLDVLRARFAPWYYVVSDDNFKKIRLSRQELLAPPKKPAE